MKETDTDYIVAHRDDLSAHAYLLGYALADATPQRDEEDAEEDAARATRRMVDRGPTQFLVAVEFAGPRVAVEEIRRFLRRGEWVDLLTQGQRAHARLDRSPTRYRAFTAALPGGWTHAVILHPLAALPTMAPGRMGYLIEPAAEADDEDERRLAHFIAALDAITPVPLLPRWAGWLWAEGEAEGLIERLPVARRLGAWSISADTDAWTALVGRGVRARALEAPRSGGEEE